jgi:hypothetical protein
MHSAGPSSLRSFLYLPSASRGREYVSIAAVWPLRQRGHPDTSAQRSRHICTTNPEGAWGREPPRAARHGGRVHAPWTTGQCIHLESKSLLTSTAFWSLEHKSVRASSVWYLLIRCPSPSRNRAHVCNRFAPARHGPRNRQGRQKSHSPSGYRPCEGIWSLGT